MGPQANWNINVVGTSSGTSTSNQVPSGNSSSVGQPGFWESLIPVWGSGRSAVDHFQNGNYWRGTGYTLLAITDVFLVKSLVVGAGKLITTGVSKLAVRSSIPHSGPIINSLGAASRSQMLAKKLKMNINSPTARQVLNSLDDTVESFISVYRKSSIRGKLPGEFLSLTVEEALKSGNTTVRKLLTDGRFIK